MSALALMQGIRRDEINEKYEQSPSGVVLDGDDYPARPCLACNSRAFLKPDAGLGWCCQSCSSLPRPISRAMPARCRPLPATGLRMARQDADSASTRPGSPDRRSTSWRPAATVGRRSRMAPAVAHRRAGAPWGRPGARFGPDPPRSEPPSSDAPQDSAPLDAQPASDMEMA
jgi:hypothetical protein